MNGLSKILFGFLKGNKMEFKRISFLL